MRIAVRIAYPVNQTVPSTDYFVFVHRVLFSLSSPLLPSSFSSFSSFCSERGGKVSRDWYFDDNVSVPRKILPFSSVDIHSPRKKLLLGIFARLRDLFKW